MKIDWNRLPPQLRNREAKPIAATTAAGLLCAVVYAIFAPNWYRSTLTVVPATPSKGGFGSQIAGTLGGVVDLPFDTGNVDIERIVAVFESRSVTDAVIHKFDLMKRYEAKYIEVTRQKLWSLCSTRIDRKARVASLSCEDRDPKFVQAMLEYFGEYGNEVFRRVSASSASEEVRFLEQRVAETRKEADESARRLREFEERYKVVDLDSQSKAVVSAMASLRSQEISKDLQLSYLSTFSSRDEASATQLRQQLAVMNAKFKKLEEQPTTDDAPGDRFREVSKIKGPATNGSDIFPPAMSVPKLRFELEQRYRDRKIHEADLLLLMQRLEMAKVNEARDTSAFQILDHPAVPTYKSRPRRSVGLAAGLFLGFLAGAVWVLGRSYLTSLSSVARETA